MYIGSPCIETYLPGLIQSQTDARKQPKILAQPKKVHPEEGDIPIGNSLPIEFCTQTGKHDTSKKIYIYIYINEGFDRRYLGLPWNSVTPVPWKQPSQLTAFGGGSSVCVSCISRVRADLGAG